MDEKTRKDTSCEMDELMRGSSEYSMLIRFMHTTNSIGDEQ